MATTITRPVVPVYCLHCHGSLEVVQTLATLAVRCSRCRCAWAITLLDGIVVCPKAPGYTA